MSIEMPRDQFGEFVSGYWVLKGLTYITLTKGFSLNPKQILPHIIVFRHDITVTILVSQNNETAAMLVSQISPVGVELFSNTNAFFSSNQFA